MQQSAYTYGTTYPFDEQTRADEYFYYTSRCGLKRMKPSYSTAKARAFYRLTYKHADQTPYISILATMTKRVPATSWDADLWKWP